MDNFITVNWHIDDVHDLGYNLTDEEAKEVLMFVKDNHDAMIGINWDVLESAIEFLYYDKVLVKRI